LGQLDVGRERESKKKKPGKLVERDLNNERRKKMRKDRRGGFGAGPKNDSQMVNPGARTEDIGESNVHIGGG